MKRKITRTKAADNFIRAMRRRGRSSNFSNDPERQEDSRLSAQAAVRKGKRR